eukprot:4133858-Prymnesium_polylepis.1
MPPALQHTRELCESHAPVLSATDHLQANKGLPREPGFDTQGAVRCEISPPHPGRHACAQRPSEPERCTGAPFTPPLLCDHAQLPT